jgi:hypothetical protein
MRNIVHKILSLSLCIVYVLASCGVVRHVCDMNGTEYLSLLANENCSFCHEHKTENKLQQCCHQQIAEEADDNDDCCEKTVETLSSDQNYSQSSDISASIFFTINAVLFTYETDLICDISSKTTVTYTPLLNNKTPLIYHTGQLRL